MTCQSMATRAEEADFLGAIQAQNQHVVCRANFLNNTRVLKQQGRLMDKTSHWVLETSAVIRQMLVLVVGCFLAGRSAGLSTMW